MPPLSSTSLLNILVERNATVANATSNALQVVCAWPVSGQYGPGSRVLYYVLIAACVIARKAEWLRNACLAAALLFPAVAALHGIVLAAVHVNEAVDMDVYGAFQLCSIGILAAPVTVRLSRTYFYDPGRNTIFLWTGLILAGLLSLTAEFFRISTSSCALDDSHNPISPNPAKFPYLGAMCGLTCSPTSGPYSPLRGGSVNNIYVIPAPDKLSFDTALLLAAACCIPAILSLISMWNKILEINWKTRFGNRHEDERIDEPIAGTNGATIEKMQGVNTMIRRFLSAVEIPVFSAAVLAILIIGERNFFSSQVSYQTEPIASIGQWAPIVGTGLATLGSLYLLLAADLETVTMKEEAKPNASVHHCNCLMQEVGRGPILAPSHAVATPGASDMPRSSSNDGRGPSTEIVTTTSLPAPRQGHQAERTRTADAGNRRKVANVLTAISNYVGTAAYERFDDSEFKRGKAVDFPEIPGEEHRNRELPRIREQYNQYQDAHGNVRLREQRSRAGSFTNSVASGLGVEGSSTKSRAASPQPPQSPHSSSPLPSPTTPRRPHASTLPAERTSFGLHNPPSSSSAGPSGGMLRQRRDTLEVPSPVHHSHTRNNPSTSSIISIVTTPQGQSSPAIVTSDTPLPANTPVFNPPEPPSPSESLTTPPTAAPPPSS